MDQIWQKTREGRVTPSTAERGLICLHSNTTTTTTVTAADATIATSITNKCIRDDTKAAARQSPNAIKKPKKYGERRFSIWRIEFLHPVM